jgi:hypothetical protein
MASKKSVASLFLFVGSTLCFFLPFVTVSCGGIKAFTLTGQQLATGTTLSEPQAFGPPQTQKIDADPFAAIAGLCGIAGIALSLIGRSMAGGAAVSGGLGALSLFILRTKLGDQLQKQSQGMAQVNYESGYTLAVLLLIAGTAWNIYQLMQSKRTASVNASPPNSGSSGAVHVPGESSSQPPCVHCGKPISAGTRFCESCGKPSEG